eukprot:TRINITY_DN6115_c0_g1_i2.p1 TRINITY_DN6115_c0_g1~~TRINITY_DN6115_c0_g1_i2.p1  ORF type:complete len:203 (-),score=36.65 TRINITY_DN6115_c0_g1_i2:16-624(-)
MQLLTKQTWLQRYHVSDSDGSSINGLEGVLMLSKFPFDWVRMHKLHSLMDRTAIVAQFNINGDIFRVASTHLESRDFDGFSPPLRKKQLETIFAALHQDPTPDHCIITGDFNFCSTNQKEEANLDPIYKDAFTSASPDPLAFVPTSGVNYAKPRRRPSRYDRILIRSSKWIPSSSCIFGTDPIRPGLFPSDHLAVECVFEWK